MIILLIGLALFLGLHSVRIFAEDWRGQMIATRGENTYKGLYSILSLAGLVLIVLGYNQTRMDMVYIWNPPVAMTHVAALLTLASFVLVAAAYVPGNHIKAAVGHPMVLGIKVWAFAHLLANGRLGDMILFGAFLAWAVFDYINSRKRDRATGVVYSTMPGIARDAAVVVAGIGAWLFFALWGHRLLIGVSPFGA